MLGRALTDGVDIQKAMPVIRAYNFRPDNVVQWCFQGRAEAIIIINEGIGPAFKALGVSLRRFLASNQIIRSSVNTTMTVRNNLIVNTFN